MRRPEKKLNILSKAEDLVDYTFNATDNTKNFPKKVRFTVSNRIQEKALCIYEALLRANEYDLRIEEEKNKRNNLQKEVLITCKELLFLIELSFNRGYIGATSCEYWSKLVFDLKYMTAAWLKRDRAR